MGLITLGPFRDVIHLGNNEKWGENSASIYLLTSNEIHVSIFYTKTCGL